MGINVKQAYEVIDAAVTTISNTRNPPWDHIPCREEVQKRPPFLQCLFLTPGRTGSSSAPASSLAWHWSTVRHWSVFLSSSYSCHEQCKGRNVTFMLEHSFTHLSLTKHLLCTKRSLSGE